MATPQTQFVVLATQKQVHTMNTTINTMVPGAVDIGNSRIKILAGGKYFSAGLHEPWQEQLHKFLWSFPGQTVMLGVSSVNPEALAALETELRKRSNVKAQPLQPLLEEQQFVDVSGIQGIGADRVLGMIGALHHDPSLIRPIITVDCGTAITINAVNVQRRCVGGAILPGLRTQFRALHEYTQLLPLLEPALDEAVAGTTTTQAMSVGVIQGAAGAVRHIIERIVEQEFGMDASNSSVQVMLAGGDAKILLKALQTWHIEPVFEPNLVLHGIAAVMAQSFAHFYSTVGARRLG